MQNNNVYRNGIGREAFQFGGKLDTIQETNSEISCIKKDGVSVLNFNSSSNNIIEHPILTDHHYINPNTNNNINFDIIK